MSRHLRITAAIIATLALRSAPAIAQETQQTPPAPADRPPIAAQPGQPDSQPGGPGRGPDGRGGPPMQQEIKLVEKFDGNGDKRLDSAERKAAREFLNKERAEGRLGRGFGRGRRGGPDGGPPGAPGGGAPGAPDGGPRGDVLRPGPDGGQGQRGGPFGGRENLPPPSPGAKLTPGEVKTYRAMPLYDLQTLRTLFLEFENADWEKELIDFHGTDVEVPAKLIVDGKSYKDVGVYFRGASSFGVGEGRKHSINLSIDFADEKQRLGGYRTINLLNSSGDPTLLCAVLYHQIAREYLPAPKANWARVAINGESWGIYVNVQQFNKDFVDEWFGNKKGARWKAPGRPNGNSGLEFLGDDVAEYKKRYEIKSKDDPESWASLIELCRVLNQTPTAQLEEKLAPILDIDGALRFLALENVFINTDGYWTRASDYSLYREENGRFHIIPHDVNETFRAAGGGPGMRDRRGGGPAAPGGAAAPGGGAGVPGGSSADARVAASTPDNPPRDANRPGDPNAPAASTNAGDPRGGDRAGRGGRGVDLDPLAGSDDPKKPLLSKLLTVPSLRARYLGYVRQIAETWLDWNKLGPIAEQYQAFLAEEVKADTRKLSSYEAFVSGVAGEQPEGQAQRAPGRGMPLKSFAEQRRAYLLAHPEITKVPSAAAPRAAQK